jgi:hypothetical protein
MKRPELWPGITLFPREWASMSLSGASTDLPTLPELALPACCQGWASVKRMLRCTSPVQAVTHSASIY